MVPGPKLEPQNWALATGRMSPPARMPAYVQLGRAYGLRDTFLYSCSTLGQTGPLSGLGLPTCEMGRLMPPFSHGRSWCAVGT